MMNHSNRMLEFIRKPKNIIISILSVGLLVNVIFFITTTASHLVVNRTLSHSYEEKEKELIKLLAAPLPSTADENEIENLEIQIPETNEYSEIYEQVRNIAMENGLIVLSFTSNNESSTNEESIETYIEENDGPNEADTNPALAPAKENKSVEGKDKENKYYRELEFNIELLGSIDQLFKYTDQLNKANRLLNVKSWRFRGVGSIDDSVLKILNLSKDEISDSFYLYETEVIAYVWKQSIVKGQPMYERDSAPSYEGFMNKFPELADTLEVQLQTKSLEDGK
jgi:Tfp pilus assembly protein PilO